MAPAWREIKEWVVRGGQQDLQNFAQYMRRRPHPAHTLGSVMLVAARFGRIEFFDMMCEYGYRWNDQVLEVARRNGQSAFVTHASNNMGSYKVTAAQQPPSSSWLWPYLYCVYTCGSGSGHSNAVPAQTVY